MNHKLKNERIRRRLVSILSCIVVFCTTYALILPAVTLERDDIVYYCGKEEHQHTDECYESPKDRPLCGLKDGEMVDGHVHDESCYKTEMVLDCLEDHEHTDECYKEEKTLVCDKEEGAQEHKHSSKCFLSTEPLCGKEVHTHSRECESNKSLKETKEDWEHSIPAKLKDTAAERMVQIALSQKDYKEVKENFELDEEGHEQYYTRYGEWYGRPYEDWNVMFVSFVLRYAGIKNEQIPYGHDWNEWIEDLTKKQLFADEGYLPKDGDLIFIKDKEDENVPDKEIRNYAGIVTDIENRKIVVGDLNGQVKEITLDDKEYETNAYVAMIESDAKDDVPADKEENDDNETNEEERPDEETGKEEANEEETDPIEFRMPEQFEIENEDFTLKLTPRVFDEDVQEENQEQTEEDSEETNEEGLKIKKFSLNEENIQDKIDAENELTKEELEQIAQANEEQKKEEEDKPLLTVQLEKIDEQAQTSEEEQAEIEQLKEQSLENVDQDNLLDLSFYKLRFFAKDQEVDLKDQKFDAELTPTEQFVEKYDTTKDLEDVAPEAEVGAEYTIIQPVASVDENQGLLDEKKKNSSSELLSKEASALSFPVTGVLFAARTSKTPNPHFTVQTYANIKENVIANKSDTTIPVVDMTTHVPVAGENVNLQHYQLENGKFKKQTALKKIYNDKGYNYHSAPNISYFDILVHNGNYTLKEIWILKAGNNSNSTTKSDWDIKKDPAKIHFTNREETYNADKSNYILITENTIIRLVYDLSNADFSSPATFYDYNITSDGQQTNINGEAQGINKKSNYTVSGTKYAFGNANTGTGLQNNKWGSHYINKYNGKTNEYIGGDPTNNGFVFGMVTGIDANGNLIWADGISAPKIFGNIYQTGKSIRGGTNNLTFVRQGDSYVLKKVSGAGVNTLSNLDTFTHPSYPQVYKNGLLVYSGKTHTGIWTNNFWPLDNSEGKDPLFGTMDFDSSVQAKETYISNNQTHHYPPGDDGKKHNNLFGMTYDIDFTLDKDYVGPLEYFFYGDDDLWVFLGEYNENTKTYESYKKICDLGGVKSSRGAHVNLRESILKLEDQTSTKKYRLKIYYTERGNSGSTCYMEFTLPSVSGAETGQTTGGVNVFKYTEDPDTTADFTFNIKFSKNGVQLKDDYAYTKYNANNESIEEDLIIASDSNFTLKKGEYISVSYLPIGTTYTISELNVDPSTKVYTSTSNSNYELNDSKVITGKVTQGGNTASAYFKNVRFFELPETGSLGISPPLMAGGASVMTTSIYAITLQRKGRWRKRKR